MEQVIKPMKDYIDEYGTHIRIFPPVGTKEDQERARARYIQIATEIQVRRALEALQTENVTPEK